MSMLTRLMGKNFVITKTKIRLKKQAHHFTCHYRARRRVPRHLRAHRHGWASYHRAFHRKKVQSLLHRLRRLFVRDRKMRARA